MVQIHRVSIYPYGGAPCLIKSTLLPIPPPISRGKAHLFVRIEYLSTSLLIYNLPLNFLGRPTAVQSQHADPVCCVVDILLCGGEPWCKSEWVLGVIAT